jgi:hypothetical protein
MGKLLEIITPEELEKEVGWTRKTQANLRSKGALPYVKLGRKIVYRLKDIRDMIELHLVNGGNERDVEPRV